MSKPEAPKKPRADRAYDWWMAIKDDRGICARLRRAPDIDAIALEAATRDLHHRLEGYASTAAYRRTALVAGVLAGVRSDAPKSGFAKALGVAKAGSDTPLMSAVRAERLRRARTPEEALGPFRRAVALLGNGTADVKDLAQYLIDWCSDHGAAGGRSFADEARIRFAFAYHGANLAAPDDGDDTSPKEDTP